MRPVDPLQAWAELRHYPDLDPRAERALRLAGQHFSSDATAEAYLREASAIAPKAEAVLIAHYRYNLYKHRFAEAVSHARTLVSIAADRLGIDTDPLRVQAQQLLGCEQEAQLRAWLFCCQAYGYVLLRAGADTLGLQVLSHLAQVDAADRVRTATLLDVIARSDQEAQDD